MVEGVVARDDHVDGGERLAACSGRDRGQLQRRPGGAGTGSCGGCADRGGLRSAAVAGATESAPCSSDQATTAQAPAWSQKAADGQRTLRKLFVGGWVFWSIDYT